MVAKLVRNYMSHICAIAYAHFVPTKEKYVHPKEIMGGSTKLHKLVENVTGTFVKPIKNEYVMNTDGTSVYYYAGIAPDDKKSYRWDRVNKDSTLSDNRNKKVCGNIVMITKVRAKVYASNTILVQLRQVLFCLQLLFIQVSTIYKCQTKISMFVKFLV